MSVSLLNTIAVLIVLIAAIYVANEVISAFAARFLKAQTASNTTAGSTCNGCSNCASPSAGGNAERLHVAQPVRWATSRKFDDRTSIS
jgi:uncharacterized protein (UPF0333 family)